MNEKDLRDEEQAEKEALEAATKRDLQGRSPVPKDVPREASDREENVQSGSPDLTEELAEGNNRDVPDIAPGGARRYDASHSND